MMQEENREGAALAIIDRQRTSSVVAEYNMMHQIMRG
jgi:hypothetical protein